MKKIVSMLVIALMAGSFIFMSLPASAAADECEWTGAINANWSNGGNWSGCDNGGVPENGDIITFPGGAPIQATINDMLGLSIQKVNIEAPGYSFSGNDFTISGVNALDASDSATFNMNIRYTGFNVFIRISATRTVVFNGITNLDALAGEFSVGSSGDTGTARFVGNIVGSAGGQFVVINGATVRVEGASNTYTANFSGAETNGIFECLSATCFGDSTNRIYAGGGLVNIRTETTFANDITTSVTTPNTSAIWAYGNITLSGNTEVNDDLYFGQGIDNKSLIVSGDVLLDTGGLSISGQSIDAQVHISGVISDTTPQSISVFSSSLYLEGANTYRGSTDATSGNSNIIVSNVDGLGDSSAVTNIDLDSSLIFDFSSDATVAEALNLVGSGSDGRGAIIQADASVTLSGPISINGDTTFGVDSSAIFSGFFLSGVISGTGDITVTASPTTSFNSSSVQFTGPSANTYVGKLTVDAVRFYPSKLGGNIAVTGDVDVVASATKSSFITTAFDESIYDGARISLTNNGPNKAYFFVGTNSIETVGYVTGDGTVSLGANTELVLSYNGDYSFDGNISKYSDSPAGDSVIYKEGSGTAAFTGGVEGSFRPVLDASDGTLVINTLQFSDIVTYVGTGSILKGNGSLGSTFTNSGSEINVGNSPGCMTFANLDLDAGTVFTEEIAGGTACSQYDKTTVTNAVELNNATLDIKLTYAPSDGTAFTIIDAASVTGTFNGLANGASLTVNGVEFTISYTATKVILTKAGGSLIIPPRGASGLLSETGIATLSLSFVGLSIVLLGGFLVFSNKRKRAL